MKTTMSALLIGAVLTISPTITFAQGADLSLLGEKEFGSNCAVCHGLAGKGEGPIVDYFAAGGYVDKDFPDLTVLAKNNKGVFPYKRVYQLIDGRLQIKGHGPRGMPVWGDEYNSRAAEYYMDYRKAWDGEAFTRTRILALIEYINTLQAE